MKSMPTMRKFPIHAINTIDVAELNKELERVKAEIALAKEHRRREIIRMADDLAVVVLGRLVELWKYRVDRVTWISVPEHTDWSVIMLVRKQIVEQGLECTYKIHANSFRIRIPPEPK